MTRYVVTRISQIERRTIEILRRSREKRFVVTPDVWNAAVARPGLPGGIPGLVFAIDVSLR
jgi:hypothetical protein